MKNLMKKIITISLATIVMVSLVVPFSSNAAFAAEEMPEEINVEINDESESAEEDIVVETEESLLPDQDISDDDAAQTGENTETTESSDSELSGESDTEKDTEPDADTEMTDASDDPDVVTNSVQSFSIDDADISGIQDKKYTGNALTQNVKVILNDKELIPGEDYSVTYRNNKNVGTAEVNISGIGDYSGSQRKTFRIYYPCSAPKILSVYSADEGVTITWEKVKDAAGYRVFRRTVSGGWEKICDTSAQKCVDKKVEFGKQYTYAVRCINKAGNLYASDFSPSGKGTTYTVNVGETSISHVYSAKLSFKVRYTKVDQAAGYEVRYSLDPTMKNCVVKSFDANEASLSVSSAPEGIYFVQARAYKEDYKGNRLYGAWSHWRLAKCVKYDIGATEEVLEQHISKAATNQAKQAVLFAFSKVGYPYSQTKRSTGDYFDCSSLAWYAWNSAGIKLTEDWVGTAAAEAQALQYKTITRDQLTPGALIFFSTSTNGRYKNITHVAMYVGDGMVVEAANTRLGVVYRKRDLNGRGTVVAYCDPCIKGGWYKESGNWSFYQSGIKLKNRWLNESQGWCWLDANGNRAINKWVKINNSWYRFNNSGYMMKSCWVKDSTGWCWLGSDGKVTKSKWIKNGGYWYYLNADGHMVTGNQTIGGKQYRFDASGRWIG